MILVRVFAFMYPHGLDRVRSLPSGPPVSGPLSRPGGETMSGPAQLSRTIDADQQHRWHVKGGNGEIISANTEGHPDPRTVNASVLSTLDAILRDEMELETEEVQKRWDLVTEYLDRHGCVPIETMSGMRRTTPGRILRGISPH